MTIKEILDKYNKQDFKNIGYEDIVMDLNTVASEEQKSDKYAFEQLAFRLQPQHGERILGVIIIMDLNLHFVILMVHQCILHLLPRYPRMR